MQRIFFHNYESFKNTILSKIHAFYTILLKCLSADCLSADCPSADCRTTDTIIRGQFHQHLRPTFTPADLRTLLLAYSVKRKSWAQSIKRKKF